MRPMQVHGMFEGGPLDGLMATVDWMEGQTYLRLPLDERLAVYRLQGEPVKQVPLRAFVANFVFERWE